jgi:cell division protein FtsB
MAAVNVKSLKKENDALKVQIENLTASMQKLEENLERREAVSAGNGDKIEDETRKHLEFYSESYDDLFNQI